MNTYAVRGRLLLDAALVPGAVVVEGDRIIEVTRTPRDGNLPSRVLDAGIIAPGLIDLQVNGGWGVEVGVDPDAIGELARRLPATGVTAFLPTLITSPADAYSRIAADFARQRAAPGARPLGLHLEGPFLSPARKGAHRQDLIEAADDALFDRLLELDDLRLMTLAPERPGGLDRIRRLCARGVVASLGHTDATAAEFRAGIDAGATKATHLYNAMSPFHHRAAGAIGAALLDPRLTVGLIADGIHADFDALQLALRTKGHNGIALVTDLMTAAAMPPGTFTLGGRQVIVDATSAHLPDGTLAGSILTMDQAIRTLVHGTGTPIAAALHMATAVPARLLNLPDRGRLAPAARADLAIFDNDLTLHTTFIAGQPVYQRPTAVADVAP